MTEEASKWLYNRHTSGKPEMKRRGGYTQGLKRQRSILLREVNSNPPPSWSKAEGIWRRINAIQHLLEEHKKKGQEPRTKEVECE